MILKGRFIRINSVGLPTTNGLFTFTLANASKTSAGIFKVDGTLIKTLWNDVSYSSGTHTEYWDATDDLGNIILTPDVNYEIKVLSNNVQYEWQGTFGNSSDDLTGPARHHGYYHAMRGLVITGSFGYFCTGYSEGTPSKGKFNTSTPNVRIEIASSGNADLNYVCSDNTKLYWGGFDSNNATNSFVYATNVSTDTDVTFTNGFNFTPQFSNKTYNTIGYVNSINGAITGLAVQKTGTNLYISRKALNKINIVNKNTGSVVGDFDITAPGNICIDNSDNIWVCSGTSVTKYNGTTGSVIISIIGLIDAKSVQVNVDGSTVVITDGGSSQQLKFYNSSTGSLIKTIGTLGGYVVDANVNNSKFYISDVNNKIDGASGKLPFVSYESDGSYWVNDPGNLRVQHFNSSDVFINRIMCIGANYSVYVDRNDITKVLSGVLEFSIDYSVQHPTGTTGWTLVRNYGATVSDSIYDLFQFSKHFITLSNGKRYAFIRKNYDYEVIEFPTTGVIRFTGVLINNLSAVLCTDGSYQVHTEASNVSTITRYPLTGFNGSNNPVWSTTGEVLVNMTQDKIIGNPVYPPTNQIFTTNLNKVVLFNTGIEAKPVDGAIPAIPHTGYHLGIYARNSNNNHLAQTEKSTHKNYSGPFPKAGFFDTGNLVNGYAGGQANIIDRNIITSYHGEFWKNSQTNKFNHYYDNGLAIGQFGITGKEITGRNYPEMAGNALTPIAVHAIGDPGSLYLIHGDEGHFSAFHRWKITGLDTIIEQTTTIHYPSSYVVPTLNYIDLMDGLAFDTVLDNTSGWTRNPLSDNYTDPYSNYWYVRTSRQSYDKLKDNDITANAVIPSAATYTISRDLGANNVVTKWRISGKVSYPDTGVNINNNVTQQFIEILDDTGKVLTTSHLIGSYLAPTYIYTNGVIMVSGSNNVIEKKVNELLNYEITVEGGVVTFTYGDYTPVVTTLSDVSADWTKPKTLRVRFTHTGSGGTSFGKEITLQNFRFYKDY